MASSFVPRLLGLAYGPAQPQSDVSDEAAASVEIQLVGGWLK